MRQSLTDAINTKLEETRYFLSHIMSVHGDSFRFELSAFLSAARSVLQYIYKQVEKTPNQTWYDAQVSQRPLVGFFRETRNLNIHTQPASPNKQIGVTLTDTLSGMTDSISYTRRDQFGNVISQGSSKPRTPTPKPQPASATVTYTYTFADWTGDEDAITLCQKYLSEIEDIVNDGTKKGFLI
jgi:hypothetical protein